MSTRETPIYRKIALDIANKIVLGEFKVGEKISGRSVLSGMYGVSPETIRRAIALLNEEGALISEKGSGIEIISVVNAEKFINKYKDSEYISTVKEDIVELMRKKKEIDSLIDKKFEKIIDFVERFNYISPFTLIEVPIKKGCTALGRRVNEVKFWQNTGATIVAVRSKDKITISPGPNYLFTLGDLIIIIGNDDVYERVIKFLYGKN